MFLIWRFSLNFLVISGNPNFFFFSFTISIFVIFVRFILLHMERIVSILEFWVRRDLDKSEFSLNVKLELLSFLKALGELCFAKGFKNEEEIRFLEFNFLMEL